MMGIGLMINRLDMGHIYIQMEQDMMENGKVISKMEKEKKIGLMVLHMKVNMLMAKSMDMEYLNGQIILYIKVILIIIIYMEKEFMLLLMVGNIMEIG